MSLPWLRSWSIRARLTSIATMVAVLVLLPVAIAATFTIRRTVADGIWDESLEAGSRVSAQVREGRVANPIPANLNGINLIQVVTPGGRIIATSDSARELPPLSMVWPAPESRVRPLTTCSLPGLPCVYLTAIRVTPEADAPVVYAGRTESRLLTSRLLELLLGLQVVLLVGFVAWVAWKVAGRALRPVEAIRAELAEITASDLSNRVPEPPGNDEISRLARTANLALERLERSIEQQRQFAADASHELRTPIAGIRAQLESALLHPDDHHEAIEASLRDTGRLESIVTDLLFLARVGTSTHAVRERIDLGELATAEVQRRSGRPPIELVLTPHVTVTGVSTHLSRVLANLLDNAERHAASRVQVEVSRTDDAAVLAVSNDGEAIPEEYHERIFERFTRIDSARSRHNGGTGLGLAIAREVVEAHHGSIGVEDAHPGVRFVIRLPLSPDDTGSPQDK